MTDRNVQVLIEKWNKHHINDSINVQEELSDFTLDVIGEIAFSHCFNTVTQGNPWSQYLKVTDWVLLLYL